MFKNIHKYLILVFFFFSITYPQEKIILNLETENKLLPFGLTTQIVKGMPKIGVALSGGGSRSLAQIGVLKALEERNIPFDIIVGTSMGSIVGGLYSAGYSLTDLDSIVQLANWQDFISPNETNRNELFIDQKITEDKAIVTLRLSGLKPILPTSLSSGHKISNFFTLLTLNAPLHVKYSFDELLKKFRAVSTDLVSGDMEILDKGSLSQSMRASSSVSFLLAPVAVDSMLLVDGGLVSNIPVTTAKNSGSDFIIAVNTTSPLHDKQALNFPWNVADQIVSIPMKKLNEQELKHADILLQPELSALNGSDFNGIKNNIQQAYSYTLKKGGLSEKIDSLYKSSFNKNPRTFYNLTTNTNPSDIEKEIIAHFDKREVKSTDLYYYLHKIISEGYHKNISIELLPDSDLTFLSVNEELNPPIKSVKIVTEKDYVKEITEPCLKSLVNTTYNSKIILQQLLNCLRNFRKDGYSLIDVHHVEFDNSTGQLSVTFTNGLIDNILIQGNSRTDEKLISREIVLEKGRLFRYNDLNESLIGLRSTNLFEEVEVALLKIGRKNLVTFKLKERPTELLRFGFKADNENQSQIMLDMRDENFIGSGTELGAIFTGGNRNRSLILEHKVNRLFDTYLTYKLRAFYGFEDINYYEEKTGLSNDRFENIKTGEYRYVHSGFSFALGTQAKKIGNIIAEIRYQNDKIKNKNNYTGDIYSIDFFSLKFMLNIDNQDKYPFPTKGLRINSYYETAQALLTGDISFSKFCFEYKGYISFNPYHTISPSLHFGFADETLPLSQQFSFGGQHKFFGFREKEYRGRQIFTGSFEYRYHLPFKLFFDTYTKIRYDLGSIWKQPEDIKFKDFKHGIGLSLSFDTPIGPADFSVGKGFIIKKVLSDNIVSWGETLFYFTIGYYY